MTPKILDYFRDILSGTLRFSQMAVLLCAFVSTGYTYTVLREKSWFQALLSDFGSIAPFFLVTVCFTIFLIIFQMISRTCSCIKLKIRQHLNSINAPQRVIEIFNQLSDWQKDFLERAVHNDKRQWQTYELPGGYDIIWKPEMEVLLQKRIVQQVGYRIFLIDNIFFDILRKVYLEEQVTNANKSD